MYTPPTFQHSTVDCTGAIKNITDMHAVLTNETADILHFNANYGYLTSKTKDQYQAFNEHTVKDLKIVSLIHIMNKGSLHQRVSS